MARQRGSTASLTVESLGEKGKGVGVSDRGFSVAVPYTAPGDQVAVRLTKKKRGIWEGVAQEFLHKSPRHIAPKCPHFTRCGGCALQHLPYSEEVEYKESVLKELFSFVPECELPAMLPAVEPWHYRNKMEFTFSQNKEGDRFLGLLIPGARGRVETLSSCHLSPPWFIDLLKAVYSWWEESGLEAYFPPKDAGSLRTLTVREGRRTGDKMVVLTVSGNADYALKSAQLEDFIATVQKVEPNISIFIQIQQLCKGQPTQFYEMHLGGKEHIRERLVVGGKEYTFYISPTAFFQPNTVQAEILYNQVIQRLGVQEGEVVLDLYCGTGTLGIMAAASASSVLGVELCKEAVLDARDNARRNEVENYQVLQGDVAEVLGSLPYREALAGGKPAVVLVDPPRSGLGNKAIEHLLRISPRRILYVSCNPKTQAEDVRLLLDQGYQLEEIQGVDQFPHTPHMEAIAVLTKRSHDISN